MEDTRELYNRLVTNLSKQFDFLEHERLTLLREQQLLEQKRYAFEEVKKQMGSVLQLQENRVKLNVGGVKFVTSLDTLLMHPDSMLGSMFSGKYRLEKDEKGFFFIDRDGTHFRSRLSSIRSPHSSISSPTPGVEAKPVSPRISATKTSSSIPPEPWPPLPPRAPLVS